MEARISGSATMVVGGHHSDNLMASKITSSSLSSMFTTLNVILDHLSKWIAPAVVGVLMVCTRDSRGLWAGMGALANWGFSVALKTVINQPRPFPAKKSDAGMPSSHSQTLFYGFTFLTLSISEFVGMNNIAITLGVLEIYFCCHLSWLRVSQKYHTRSQVVVGALLGTSFCVAWLRTWRLIVFDAFRCFLWVRVVVVLGAAAFWMVLLLSITVSTFRPRRRLL